MKRLHFNRVYRIPLIYGLFSIFWIFFSDKIAFAAAPDISKAALFSLIKGLLFVISSTLLIYLLLKAEDSGKKRLMNEMVAVQRSFNLLFEDNPQPMWIYDNKTLDIMAVNPAACRVYGYSSSEFRKLKITELRKEQDVPLLMKTIADYKDELRQSGPWEHLKKNGETIMVQVISHPLRSVGVDSTLVSIIDITEQQKALEELDSTMQQRDDFESFGYTVSHDLKAPLRAIMGYSDILSKEYKSKLDDEGQKFIDQIHKAGKTMNEMLDDLMILTGISRKPLNLEWINLSTIYEDEWATIKHQDAGRDVDVEIQPEMTAFGDVGAVRLITQNLFQNAWKYTKRTENARIQMGSLKNEDSEIVFFIKDNGLGFNQSMAGEIFEPFKRAHSNSAIEGLGIGLSIARRAVERHGGRIWAESNPGNGACFYFTLANPDLEKKP